MLTVDYALKLAVAEPDLAPMFRRIAYIARYGGIAWAYLGDYRLRSSVGGSIIFEVYRPKTIVMIRLSPSEAEHIAVKLECLKSDAL